MQPIIEVEGIRKTYGKTVAVSDVSFSVQPGEIFRDNRTERRRQDDDGRERHRSAQAGSGPNIGAGVGPRQGAGCSGATYRRTTAGRSPRRTHESVGGVRPVLLLVHAYRTL